MTKEFNLPDGTVGVFPDTMSDADIAGVLSKQFPAPKLPKATASSPLAKGATFTGEPGDDRVRILKDEYGKTSDPVLRKSLEREASRLGYTQPLGVSTPATPIAAPTKSAASAPSIYDTSNIPDEPDTAGAGQSMGMGVADLLAGAGKFGNTLLAPFDFLSDLQSGFKNPPANLTRARAIEEFAREHGGKNWTSMVNQAAAPLLATGKPLAGVESMVSQGVTKAAPLVSPLVAKTAGVAADIGTNAALAGVQTAAEGGELQDVLDSFRNAAVLGGAFRGTVGGVRMGLDKALKSPVPDHLAKFLRDNGIPVTPGMLYPKSWIATLEKYAKRYAPGLGGSIEEARGRTGKAYVEKVANDALSSLHDVVPDQLKPRNRPGGPVTGAPPNIARPPTGTGLAGGAPLPEGAPPGGAAAPPGVAPVPESFQPGKGGPLVVNSRGQAGVPAVIPEPEYTPLWQRRLEPPVPGGPLATTPPMEPLEQGRLPDRTTKMAEEVPPGALPPPGSRPLAPQQGPTMEPLEQRRLNDPTVPLAERVNGVPANVPGEPPMEPLHQRRLNDPTVPLAERVYPVPGHPDPGTTYDPLEQRRLNDPTVPLAERVYPEQPHVDEMGSARRGTTSHEGYTGGEPNYWDWNYKLVPSGGKAAGEGLSLVKSVHKQIDAAYRKILPFTAMRVGDGLSALQYALHDLNNYHFMSPNQRQMVASYLEGHLIPKLRQVVGERGALTGREIKDFDEMLGDKAREFLGDPQTSAVAEALFNAQKRFRAATIGLTPEHRHALQLVNEAFRKALPLHRATEEALSGKGIPSPVHLRRAMEFHKIKPDELNDAMSEVAPHAPESDRLTRLGVGSAASTFGLYSGHWFPIFATMAASRAAGKFMYSPAGVERMVKLLESPEGMKEFLKSLPAEYSTQIGRELSK